MSTGKNVLMWSLALIIMLAVYVYQKRTGPTYPLKGEKSIGGVNIDYKLPRSHPHDSGPFLISVNAPENFNGKVKYRRFKSYDDFSFAKMERKGDELVVELEHLDAAGKYMYQVILENNGKETQLTEDFITIRFRGGVPGLILYPHIFFMFFAMWLTMRAGLEAVSGVGKEYNYAFYTTLFFFIGGFIFGPIMQKYAFGEYWTGWPFGHDMTDNKVLGALVIWILTLIIGKIKPSLTKIFVFIAVIVQIGIYLIPHSTLGSELDYRPIQENSGNSINKENDSFNDLIK